MIIQILVFKTKLAAKINIKSPSDNIRSMIFLTTTKLSFFSSQQSLNSKILYFHPNIWPKCFIDASYSAAIVNKYLDSILYIKHSFVDSDDGDINQENEDRNGDIRNRNNLKRVTQVEETVSQSVRQTNQSPSLLDNKR